MSSPIRILAGRFHVGSPNVVVMLECERSESIQSPRELMAALKSAISEVIAENPDEWKHICGFFNVGDLAASMDRFEEALTRYGLGSLKLVAFDEIIDFDEQLLND